jgi:transposase InsO family protein
MRDFAVEAPNTAWVTDITYLATLDGWLYLAVILDLFSRRVVGYAMSERIDRALVLEALRKALLHRPGVRDLIHHSDRGSQLGFKGSSQHLEIEELRWPFGSVERRTTRCVHPCSHPAGHRPAGANIDSGSGRGSSKGCRARKPGSHAA